MARNMEKIVLLQYKTIEKGFYQVSAFTDDDKTCIEGRVCGGILKELMRKTTEDKGKIARVRCAEDLYDDDLRDELKDLRKENKEYKVKFSKIKRLVKNV